MPPDSVDAHLPREKKHGAGGSVADFCAHLAGAGLDEARDVPNLVVPIKVITKQETIPLRGTYACDTKSKNSTDCTITGADACDSIETLMRKGFCTATVPSA